MSFWKVLGGIAAGVGLVVALPVAGPIGAVSAIGAAVGASGGAIAGGIASAIEDEEKKAEYNKGKNRGIAEQRIRIEKLVKSLEEAQMKLKEDKNYYELIVALFAVGMTTANSDGCVSNEELIEIEEFCVGISGSYLPAHIREEIDYLKENPPSFNTSLELVRRLDHSIDKDIVVKVIELVAYADNNLSEPEKKVLFAFQNEVA